MFSWEDGGDTIVVDGGGGILSTPAKGKELYLGNAGTASRFLTTVCAMVSGSASSERSTIITGNARMKQRPIGPLVDALTANGAKVKYLESTGCLPLDIDTDGFRGGHIQLAASVSSQYVSSILLCAPYAAEQVTLELTGGQVISQPYIDMTIAMMEQFGAIVERQKDEQGNLLDVYVIPKCTYVNPSEYSVESDASSATYPLAIAAITGTTCTISNIGSSSLQGDARFAKEVLEPMGCIVEQTLTSTKVTGPPVGTLRALGNVDMEPMTDAFLTASVLAAVAVKPCLPERKVEGLPETASRIYGIANQRVKECNRIQAMRDQLGKLCNLILPARMLIHFDQLNSVLRLMNLTTVSSFLASPKPHSSEVLLFTAMTIIAWPWRLRCCLVSLTKPSSRKSVALRRLGPISGMTYKTRCALSL